MSKRPLSEIGHARLSAAANDRPRRPLSAQFVTRTMGVVGIPTTGGDQRYPLPSSPAEPLSHRSHALSPAVLGNDMTLRVMISEALQDASNFTVFPASVVSGLRREFQDLAERAAKLVPQLAMEEKIREAARNMIILYRENRVATLKAQEELAAANAKVDNCATELWHVTKRRMEVQKHVLEHTAGVLLLAVDRMGAAWEKSVAAAAADSRPGNSGGQGHITSEEWEAREDEFQAAFKRELENHAIATGRLEETVRCLRQEIAGLDEKLKRAGSAGSARGAPPSVQSSDSDTEISTTLSNVTLSASAKEDAVARQDEVEDLKCSLRKALAEAEVYRRSLLEAQRDEVARKERVVELERVLVDLRASYSLTEAGRLESKRIQVEQAEALERQARTVAQLRAQLEDAKKEMEIGSLKISRPPVAASPIPGLPQEIGLIVQESMRQVLAEREALSAKQMQAERDHSDQLRNVIKEMEAKHAKVAAKLAEAEAELEMRHDRADTREELGGRPNQQTLGSAAANANLEYPLAAVAAAKTPENSRDGNGTRKSSDDPGRAGDVAKELQGELARLNADFAALKDYNGRMLGLLKNLHREISACPKLTRVQKDSARDDSASTPDGAAGFTFEGFIGRIRSIWEENGLLLGQVQELQFRNENLTVRVDELTEKAALLAREHDEERRKFEEKEEAARQYGVRLEEERRNAVDKAAQLAAEISALKKSHEEEVGRILAGHEKEAEKIWEDCGRQANGLREAMANETRALREGHEQEIKRRMDETAYVEAHLHHELDNTKRALDEANAELSQRRKAAEVFESDRIALEARAESAAAKAVRYRNELSEARLKPILDAADADGLETLRKEFRRVMNDLRSEHAQQMRQEEDEHRRLEALVMEIRRQNEDLVAEINTRPARAELAASGLPREDHPFNDQRSDRSSVAGSHRRASVPSAAGPAACAQMSAPRQSVDDPALLLPPGSSARSDPSHCPEAPTSGTRPDRRDRRPLPAAPPSRGAPAQALPVDHDDVGCGQSRHSPPSPASDTSSPQQQPPLPPAHSSAGPADKTLPPAPACHGAPLPPAKHAKDKKRFSLFNGV